MSNPTPTTGDDLIIIADETHDTSVSSVDATNPLGDILGTSSTDTSVAPAPEITFDTSEASSDSSIDSVSTDVDMGDFSLDLTSTEKEVTPESSTEASPVDLSLESTNKTETVIEQDVETSSVENIASSDALEEDVEDIVTQISSSDSDMDSILADTIDKLSSRQENIRSIKDSKMHQIDSLNEKIGQLKGQVSDLKDEVSDLDAEDEKIQANVLALENMKSTPSGVSAVDVKEHNQKRVVKRTPVKV